MRFLHRGVLLGIFFSLFIFCKQVTKQFDSEFVVQIGESQATSQDALSIHSPSSTYSTNFYDESKLLAHFDLVHAYIHDNNCCKWRYDLTVHDIKRLLRLDYVYIVAALLKLEQLSNKGIAELWCLYKEKCWKSKKVKECEAELLEGLQERAQKFQEKLVEHQKKVFEQEELQKQKLIEKERLRKLYHDEILNLSNPDSPYHQDRQLALHKTKSQQYQKYEQAHNVDEQVIGLCLAKDIDYHKLQCVSGTAMQHQMYDEVIHCYKKISQLNVTEGLFVHLSLDAAQFTTESTELEIMQLAIVLSDMAHACADTVCSIVAGVGDSVEGIVHVVTDPIGTVTNLGIALGRVMKYVAEAMLYADSESLGWSQYAQTLEQEHQYDAALAREIVHTMKHWIEESSGQEKIRFMSRLITDAFLYPKCFDLLSRTSKMCCGMIAEIPELRFLEGFSDVYAEYGLATELGEVGLQSIEDLGISLMKSEMDNFKKSKSIKDLSSCNKLSRSKKQSVEAISKKVTKDFPNEEKLIKATRNKKYWSKTGANNVAVNANAREGLVEKIESLLSGQKKAVKIRKLPDGRIRYYKAEKPSKTPGPTRGSSYVTEYDPNRGIVRSWQESYDQSGNVNRIHPKSLNGADVIGQHYPPIGKEIEFWKNLKD